MRYRVMRSGNRFVAAQSLHDVDGGLTDKGGIKAGQEGVKDFKWPRFRCTFPGNYHEAIVERRAMRRARFTVEPYIR